MASEGHPGVMRLLDHTLTANKENPEGLGAYTLLSLTPYSVIVVVVMLLWGNLRTPLLDSYCVIAQRFTGFSMG